MHVEAHAWVAQYASDLPLEAIEFGARDINGSIDPVIKLHTNTLKAFTHGYD